MRDLALRPRDVMGAFGNTPQALLTVFELGSGSTLQDVAREAGISIHTARSQLKAVFDKTGTTRQADLVRLLVAANAL